MLRRKLIMFLGAVVLLLVATVAASLWQLQDVLAGQDHINREAMTAVDQVNTINAHIAQVQVELYQLQLHDKRRLDRLIELVEALRQSVAGLGAHYLAGDDAAGPLHAQLVSVLPEFERHIGALATSREETSAKAHNQAALSATIRMQRSSLALGQFVRAHALTEQRELTDRFRWTVVSLTLVFLLVIHIAIFVLLHIAKVVVEPVEKLTEASRRLAEGDYSVRVHVDQHDEFDELAASFNNLSQQLAATEARRIEVLQQVGIALSHELNNAMAIIEMQLKVLGRRSTDNPAQSKALRQIHESLQRMTQTVQDLRHVRRIVLTDYASSGQKMLDIARSIQLETDERLPHSVTN